MAECRGGCCKRNGLRTFVLERDTDVSGVSGTGTVCEGVQFSDGRCVMRWLGGLSSVAIYDSSDDLLAIHGHDGATRLVWTS